MKTEKAYMIGTHPYSFRSGEAAEIIGVVFIETDDAEWRLNYHIRFADGVEDYFPCCDDATFTIVPLRYQDRLAK